MSEKLFSLYRYDTGECLIADVNHEEITKRQKAYYARGGKSSLAVVGQGEEFQPRRVQAITVTDGEPEPIEVQATQEALPGTGVAKVVMGKKASVLAAQWIMANAARANMDYSWAVVVDRALKGKDCTIKELQFLQDAIEKIKANIGIIEAMQ